MTVRGYKLALDWSRSGGYGGPYEDVSSYLADDDLTIEVGRETSQAASELSASTLGFALEDRAKIFAPELSTSPITGKVDVGVPATFSITVAAATTTLYTGLLDELDYDPDRLQMTGKLIDAWGKPGAEQLSTALYQGQRTGDLINVILDEIGWTGGRDIDSGATVVPFWWAEGKDAATAVQELVDSEGPPAVAYVEAGVFVFRDRHHRITDTASLTSQATFVHAIPSSSAPGGSFKILKNSFNYNSGRRNLVNSATFQIDIRKPGDTVWVWQTDSPITIAANQSVTLFVKTDEPFINAQTPTDVPVMMSVGGLLAPDYVMTGGTITPTLDRTSGQSLILTLTAGGTDAIVQSLALRAIPITVAQAVKVTWEDAGSVASKGLLSWGRPLPWANQYDALAIAQRIVAVYAVRRPVLTLSIDGTISTTYLQQFAARKVGDRVTVEHDIVGLAGDFIVEKVIRTVRSLGKRGTVLTLVCEAIEPVGALVPFTFDVAGRGFNDGAFQTDGIDNPAAVFRFDVAGKGFNDGRFAS